MEDVAAQPENRNVQVQRVGIRQFHLPLMILQQQGGYQHVLAEIEAGAELPKEYRGSHLSRFVEILNEGRQQPWSEAEMERALKEICTRLKAPAATLTLKFKYFVEKPAPVSGKVALLDYDCCFYGALRGGHFDFSLGVTVPAVTVCPCSKAISDYGAHGQRGLVRVKVRYEGEILWLEDLISLVEAQLSAPVYPLLKREDEKFVTERSWERAKFVEDVTRDVVLALRAHPQVTWFEVECEHFESIHNHNAYAFHSEGEGEGDE